MYLFAKERAIWAQNSTAMPVAMTRLTNETALSEIFQTTITPIKLIIINDIVIATQTPAAAPNLFFFSKNDQNHLNLNL